MLRAVTVRQEDGLRRDPGNPVIAHLYGRMRRGEDHVALQLPDALQLRSEDDYALKVDYFSLCFTLTHKHFDKSADHSAKYPTPKSFIAEKAVSSFDDPAFTSYGPQDWALSLDGLGDVDIDDDDVDEDGPVNKRQKRQAPPRPKGDVLRADLRFTHDRIPSRPLEVSESGIATPVMIVKALNARYWNMHREEFLGLTAGGSVSFYILESSKRIVVSLPPLAVVYFDHGRVLWEILGFRQFPTGDATTDAVLPFHAVAKGDLCLVNTSPFKTRLYVADVSVADETPLHDSTVARDVMTALSEILQSKLRVYLARARSSATLSFDFSGQPDFRNHGLAGAADPPPGVATYTLNRIAKLCLDAASFAAEYSYEDDQEKMAGLVDRDFQFGLDAYPSLSAPPLHRLAAKNKMTLTFTAGEAAARRLGLAHSVFPLTVDAGSGHSSTGRSDFLRSAEADAEAWDATRDGPLATVLYRTQAIPTALAKDVTVPAESAAATQKGVLARARIALYKQLSRTTGAVATLPSAIAKALSDSDEVDDYEYPASDFQLLQKDGAPRNWLGMTALDSKRQLVPVGPREWDKAVTESEWTAAVNLKAISRAVDAEKKKAATEEATLAKPVAQGPAQPVDPSTEQQQQQLSGQEEEIKPAGPELEPVFVDPAEIAAPTGQEEAGAADPVAEDASAAAAAAAAATAAASAIAEPDPVEYYQSAQYDSAKAGLSVSKGLCPLAADDVKLPDNFYLVVDEGEKRDWMGPLGPRALLGRYNKNYVKDARDVVLRGGGNYKFLTFRVVGMGYDTFRAPSLKKVAEDGLVVAVCRFHPYRDSALELVRL